MVGKKIVAIFALSAVVLVTYQNCAPSSFKPTTRSVATSQGTPTTIPVCPGPTVPCQTDLGSGTETCTDSPDGPVYGNCVIDTCITGYVLSSGVCVPVVLPYLTVKAFGPNLPSTGTTQFSSVPGKTYTIQVSGSADVIASGLDNALSSFTRLQGQCAGSNSYTPWTSDVPANSTLVAFGNNTWLYTAPQAGVIGGCSWNGCLTSNNDVKACLHIDAMACVPSSSTQDGCSQPANGSSTRVCAADGMSYGSCVESCNSNYQLVNGQCVVNPCTNGATNPPSCNSCPVGQSLNSSKQCVNNSCGGTQASNSSVCAGDTSVVPTGTQWSAVQSSASCTAKKCEFYCGTGLALNSSQTACVCSNGATNAPACDSCPVGQALDSNHQCVANSCGGTQPTNSVSCAGDTTTVPTGTNWILVADSSKCTSARKCESYCATGAVVSGNACQCSNGATNPTSGCDQCPVGKSYSGGQCVVNVCAGTQPANSSICSGDTQTVPTGTQWSLVANVSSCTTATKCEAYCGTGASIVSGACQCANGATNPTSGCNQCAAGQIYSNSSCVDKVDGLCGSANGSPAYSETSANLCSKGNATTVSYDQNGEAWTWQCQGLNTGSSANCSAPRKLDAETCITGTSVAPPQLLKNWCGYPVAISSDPSTISISGDPVFGLYWTCPGINGGASKYCATAVDPVCASFSCFGSTGALLGPVTGGPGLPHVPPGSGDKCGTFIPQPPGGLVNPEVDANCSNGIEINNLNGQFELDVTSSASVGHKAWLDYATYVAPNTINIYALDINGKQSLIFSQCEFSTASYPFVKVCRPPNDSIRQKALSIPKGTVKLLFDLEGGSPMYIKMVGLCEFNRSGWKQIGGEQWPIIPTHDYFGLYPENAESSTCPTRDPGPGFWNPDGGGILPPTGGPVHAGGG